MGRIKSTLVKRTSKQLVLQMTEFDSTFNTNKKILGSTMPSKKMRNKIAGYIARMKRAELEAESKRAKRAAKAELASQQAQQEEQYQVQY